VTSPTARLLAFLDRPAVKCSGDCPDVRSGGRHNCAGGHNCLDAAPVTDAEWLAALLPLIRAAAEEECVLHRSCIRIFHAGEPCKNPEHRCTHCQGTGLRHPDLLLRIAVKMAWAAWKTKYLGFCLTQECGCGDCPPSEERAALRACDAWLADKTEERRQAWANTLFGDGHNGPPKWIPWPFASFTEHPKAPHSKADYLCAKIKAALPLAGREAGVAVVREEVGR
jgi:hypothetical protein